MGKSPGKPGRPKKPVGEKLEQFSIRLPPKLKFGLELLARLHGRSLSQAIEWALNSTLATTKLGSPYRGEQVSLMRATETALDYPEGWMRTLALYRYETMLVTFEERHACDLVDRSVESMEVHDEVKQTGVNDSWRMWVDVMSRCWPQLLKDSAEFKISAQMETNRSIFAALQLNGPRHRSMSFTQRAEVAIKTLDERALRDRVSEGFSAASEGIQVLANKLQDLSATSGTTGTAKPAGKRKPRGATKP